jgi:hypothetical protein
VGEWLAGLQPPPPPALMARLAELLAPHAAQPASHVPDVCVESGERLLDALLASGSTSRGTALDLLAVDALMTYAFQAAADTPTDLEVRAARAMGRIAALPEAKRD